MSKKDLQKIVEQLFFSKEAADYLGISVQRLNQLVHSGQITPIKASSAGSLFYLDDLIERKESVKSIGTDIKKNKSKNTFDLSSELANEAVNYFALQSFYNNSDKKTLKVLQDLDYPIFFNISEIDLALEVNKKLGIDVNQFMKARAFILKGFEKLSENDVILKKGTENYPKLLSETEEAPPYLFARGNISLLNEKIVSVVGSRLASQDGIDKAYKLSRLLGKNGVIVASGLAKGIDTAAHTASLENNFSTIAVIGTSLAQVYPNENENLQKSISENGLVLTQFPPSSKVQRWHFPMRNAIMSGISLATVIVEAGETSGALKQADYALKQNRLVFIPQSALDNNAITWPKKYIQREGANKFSRVDELLKQLKEQRILSKESYQVSLFEERLGNFYVHDIQEE